MFCIRVHAPKPLENTIESYDKKKCKNKNNQRELHESIYYNIISFVNYTQQPNYNITLCNVLMIINSVLYVNTNVHARTVDFY